MIFYSYSDNGCIVCSEKTYPIKEGTLLFIGAGKYHYTMPETPENYVRSKIFFRTEMLRNLLQAISAGEHFRDFSENSFVYAIVPASRRTEVDMMFRQLKNVSGDLIHSEVLLASVILAMLSCLDRFSLEITSADSGYMSKAVEFINRNITGEISIDKICEAVNVSKYHFCRKFKECTGMTVMDYILNTRITLAKSLLREKDNTVTAISENCGFSSVSYFCRVFKEETGRTPLGYRKEFI